MEKIIQKASFHDAKIIAFLVSQSNKDIADKFGLTIENNPKHPSFYTKKWYLKLGFIEGKTKSFDHLPFDVTFMSYDL